MPTELRAMALARPSLALPTSTNSLEAASFPHPAGTKYKVAMSTEEPFRSLWVFPTPLGGCEYFSAIAQTIAISFILLVVL